MNALCSKVSWKVWSSWRKRSKRFCIVILALIVWWLLAARSGAGSGQQETPSTIVAEMITELIRFEPELCICNGNSLEFKRESVSAMRDLLLTFPQICLCNGDSFFWQHDLVSVIGYSVPPGEVPVCDQFGYYCITVWSERPWADCSANHGQRQAKVNNGWKDKWKAAWRKMSIKERSWLDWGKLCKHYRRQAKEKTWKAYRVVTNICITHSKQMPGMQPAQMQALRNGQPKIF